jgi:outer membrane protein TolC
MSRGRPCVAYPATLACALVLLAVAPRSTRAQEAPSVRAGTEANLPGPASSAPEGRRVQPLTLDEAIRLAMDQSFDIYRLEQRYLAIAYGLEAARRNLKTRVDFTGTVPSASLGTKLYLFKDIGEFSAIYLEENTQLARGAVNVTKPLITNGSISLSGRVLAFNMSSKAKDPSLNDIKGMLRAAELDMESLELSYTEEELRQINEITRRFYGLLGYQRAVQVAEESYQQSLANLDTGQRRFDVGLIPEVELLSLQVTRLDNEARLVSARNDLDQLRADFNRLIGIPLDTPVQVVTEMDFRPLAVDLATALQRASANRSDVRRAEIDLEQARMDLERTASDGRPDLRFNASVDLTGHSTFGGLDSGDSWGRHFSAGFNPDNVTPFGSVNLTLRVPIMDSGLNRARIERQLASVRTMEREVDEAARDLERDVVNTVRSLETAMERARIQDRNRAIADSSYGITRRLFEESEVSSTDLLLALERRFDSEIRYIDSLVDYELAKARLKELTLWDWDTNRPVQRRTSPPRPFEER